MGSLLSIRRLQVSLPTRDGLIRVVDSIDLTVEAGMVAGIAGESGSGKTLAMMAVLGLLPSGAVVAGEVEFQGRDLLTCSQHELEECRGKEIALVMQDPSSCLHPMLSIGGQLTDHARHHLRLSRREARIRAIELLRQVRIPDPKGSFDAYPHQLSGGMRQRVSIAIALACGPKLLIADEPTTGLDVTVQAGILHLLRDLQERHQLGIVLISHDLGVVSAVADSVAVMYAGRVVETGSTAQVLRSPRHPYTAALLAALPHPDRPDVPLMPIPGHLGPPNLRPSGCAFHPRCAHAQKRCSEELPALIEVSASQQHACFVDPFANEHWARQWRRGGD